MGKWWVCDQANFWHKIYNWLLLLLQTNATCEDQKHWSSIYIKLPRERCQQFMIIHGTSPFLQNGKKMISTHEARWFHLHRPIHSLVGQHLIDFTILVVHSHDLLCVRRHLPISSACIQNFNHNIWHSMPYDKLIVHYNLPFFSPCPVCIQIVPDGMVIKWVTCKFQALGANLNQKNQVRIETFL